MAPDGQETSGALDPEARKRLRMAHLRLRNASQAIESLLATEQLKGRWPPAPAPAEAVHGALNEFHQAYQAVEACHRDLALGDGERRDPDVSVN